MGPNESKLQQIKSADPGDLVKKKEKWHEAVTQIDSVLEQLESQRRRTAEAWTGDDSEAAATAFAKKHALLQSYKDKMKSSGDAMEEAGAALIIAQISLAILPSVGSPPTAPGPLEAGSSKEVRDLHASQSKKYDADKAEHAAAIEAREAAAGRALKTLDTRIATAQSLLATAAPPLHNVDSSDQSGGDDGGGTTGGSSGTPVVGGSTSAGLIGGAGVFAVKGKKPDKTPLTGSELGNEDGDQVGATGVGGDTPANAGTVSGGGIGAAASGAGLLGAGRGIVNKLTGASSSASASGAGRTAGMQNGSTLGSRTAGASQSSPAQGAARSGATQGGQGQPGQAGRSGSSQAGQAGRPGATQAGRPGSSSGARSGPGSNSAGRAGSRTAGNSSRAGGPASRTAGKPGEDKDTTIDHMAFEDDQWLDDEETAPGVIT